MSSQWPLLPCMLCMLPHHHLRVKDAWKTSHALTNLCPRRHLPPSSTTLTVAPCVCKHLITTPREVSDEFPHAVTDAFANVFCRVFDHWEVITQDPMKPDSPSNVIMLDVRKRKGLKPEPNPITEYEDKL